jgi:pimeloyl-ACP methyl ester carboxylesterase
VFPPELKAGVEGMVGAIEGGDNEPRRQFIANNLFMPTSDKALVDRVLQVMMASPTHVAAGAMKGVLGFDGPGAAARCKVPALHLAAQPPLNPPHLMSQWLPNVVNGWTVGAGHFNMMEAPDQVPAMIEAFLRHYV